MHWSGHKWLGLLWLVANLFTSVIFPLDIIKFAPFLITSRYSDCRRAYGFLTQGQGVAWNTFDGAECESVNDHLPKSDYA